MQSSSDSSVWRSLAVAFGDGLAFGVGMKLTQNAARQNGTAAQSEPGPLAERVERLEQHLKRIERPPTAAAGALDQKVLDAIVNALEARLIEHSGQIDRRLADLDAKISIEEKSRDQQTQSVAQQVAHDIAALHGQMVSVNREFGEMVGRIVAEQVASQVEARTAAAESGLETRVAALIEPVEARLREEIGRKNREIAELVGVIGRLCLQAAEGLGSPPPTLEEPAADPQPAAPAEAPEPDDILPGFAQPLKPKLPWRVPLVSSFVLAVGGLVLMHYL